MTTACARSRHTPGRCLPTLSSWPPSTPTYRPRASFRGCSLVVAAVRRLLPRLPPRTTPHAQPNQQVAALRQRKKPKNSSMLSSPVGLMLVAVALLVCARDHRRGGVLAEGIGEEHVDGGEFIGEGMYDVGEGIVDGGEYIGEGMHDMGEDIGGLFLST